MKIYTWIIIIALVSLFWTPRSAQSEIVAKWMLNNDANPQPDTSGYSNNATLGGDTFWTNSYAGRDGAMYFDGNNDYMEISDSPSLSITGDITIAAWVYVTGSGYQTLFFKGSAAYPFPYDFRLINNTPQLGVGNGMAIEKLTGVNAVQYGEWQHVACTVSGTNATFYVNGYLNKTLSFSQERTENTASVWLGNRADKGADFGGYLDEIAVWNEALSAQQMNILYWVGVDAYDTLYWKAGDALVQPVDALASNEYTNRRDDYTIDGSGLSDTSIVETGDGVPSTWPGHTNAANAYMWHSSAGITPVITFDIGEVNSLRGFHLWNYNELGGSGYDKRGFKTATVSVSVTGTSIATAADFIEVPITPGEFIKGDGTSNYQGQDYFFYPGGAVNARFIKFECTTNWGDTQYTGLSEIRFVAIPPPIGTIIIIE